MEIAGMNAAQIAPSTDKRICIKPPVCVGLKNGRDYADVGIFWQPESSFIYFVFGLTILFFTIANVWLRFMVEKILFTP
jgi:hypothetical protein